MKFITDQIVIKGTETGITKISNHIKAEIKINIAKLIFFQFIYSI
jgi:hypothetical protein